MPPRLLRPKSEDDPEGGDAASDAKGGRRKAVSSACIPCRRRKSKCDGGLPACSTCVAVYRTECSYDADSDHRRKGALKRDIQSLQQQNDALDVIVASLRSLPESDAISLLHHLRSDVHPDVVAGTLRRNVPLPLNLGSQTLEADFAQQNASPSSPVFPLQSLAAISRSPSGEESQSLTSGGASALAAATWFKTPQDADFIAHLLDLYFCWIHPFHHFISRQRFTNDMDRGRTECCSPVLVNAMAALACHYSDRAMARTDPDDPSTAGDHFYADAKQLLHHDEKPCLTTVQALGIMALRETSAGHDSNGYQLAGRCVRMALELGLHLSVMKGGTRPAETEARKVTFWAVFNLETMCAVAVGRLSQLPRSAADIDFPSINHRYESSTWRPYQDINLALSPSAEQPAKMETFQQQLSRLSELASEMVNTFYAPKERFTSRRLATTYSQYRQWYHDMPDDLRLENTSLPHVLVLHMYYYTCVLLLFRPYIKLDLRGANLFPRDTCTFCANEISSLMNASRAMYGLRRVCLTVVSLLLSASTIHLLNLPSEPAASHLSQALHDLEAIAQNHRSAARAIGIIRSLSHKWNIALPEGAASDSMYRMIGMQDVSPPPASTFFIASIPHGQEHSRSGGSSASSSGSPFGPPGSHNPHPSSLQRTPVPILYSDPTFEPCQTQPAFWTPFPAQGMPMQQGDLDTNMLRGQNIDSQSWASMGPPSEPHDRHQSTLGRTDEFAEWNWQ